MTGEAEALRAQVLMLTEALEEFACPGLRDCPHRRADGSCRLAAEGRACGDIARRALAWIGR